VDKDGNSPLHYACKYNRISVAILLARAGADVNAKNNIGWTPLHTAASEGHSKLLQQLVAQSEIDVC